MIFRPSGDQAGSPSNARSRVRFRLPLPSAFMRQSRSYRRVRRRRRSSARRATRRARRRPPPRLRREVPHPTAVGVDDIDPSRVLSRTKAIFRPSGDQTGSEAGQLQLTPAQLPRQVTKPAPVGVQDIEAVADRADGGGAVLQQDEELPPVGRPCKRGSAPVPSAASESGARFRLRSRRKAWPVITKAIRRPSGDQAGVCPLRANFRCALPSAFTT